MTPASRLLTASVAALALAVGLAGCGDPMLWTRYRAERDSWRAGRAIERIQLNPQFAGPDDYARAEAALDHVVRNYPPERYATEEALRDPYRADIARIAGRAAVVRVQLRQAQGDEEGAAEAYARILEAYGGVPVVAREAMHGRGLALMREGAHREAAGTWRALWDQFPLVPEGSDAVSQEVLAAPFESAEALDLAGAPGEARALLADAALRMREEAARQSGTRSASMLLEHASEAAARAGDPRGAMDALRAAMAEPAAEAVRARMVMSLAQRHLERGDADSTLVYTAWAQRDFGPEVRTQAVLLGAQAFEALGMPDSALSRLNVFLEGARLGSDGWVRARYARARVLERRDVWEQARSEYRTIAAGAPAHVLSIEALVRIVEHHVARDENELARMEGRHAIEAIDRLLGVARDDSVQVRGRLARGEVQLALEDPLGAFDKWSELWRRYPGSGVAAAAALEAAALAERRLGDRDGAQALYAGLAEGAPSAELREKAREALRRLGGTPGGTAVRN